MAHARIERSIADKPSRWFRPASARVDLWYLGWGQRYFGLIGRKSIVRRRWTYFMLRAGTPTFLHGDRRLKLAPHDLLITHPDCLTGWSDEARSRAELFLWTWDSPPRCAECRPPTGGFLHRHLRGEDVVRLQAIHDACRKEVAALDDLSPLALEHLRLCLDVTLARCLRAPVNSPPPADLLQRAKDWMQQNLSQTHCTSLLSDFLQVTPPRLEKLFHEQTGRSPLRYFKELKMDVARNRLKAGQSVKSVAYALGYRHANDFSRAFKSVVGKPPAKFGVGR